MLSIGLASALSLLSLSVTADPTNVLETHTTFAAVNYTWDDAHTYKDYVDSKQFKVENCLLAGINVDRAGTMYVTVPRWKSGVPATLNKLVKNPAGTADGQSEYLLSPWPSWDMQREGVSGDLQNVQSMTIDSTVGLNDSGLGRMWVIDVGRRNFYDLRGGVEGAASVWLVDVGTGTVQDRYEFPPSVVSYDNSFLNDVVLDEDKNVAYLSDAWDAGAIIVLNMNTRTSRRFAGPATANDPSYSMVINGKNYGKHIFTTPTDGIAITADKNALFFCQVQGTTLYRVPTAVLQDDSTAEDSDPNAAFNAAVQVLGTKEPSDGMKYVGDTLYWGALTQSTLYSMRVNATSAVADMETEAQPWVAQDTDTMQWLDTFAIDLSSGTSRDGMDATSMYFVSNKLNRFVTGAMNFGEEGNMHIMKMTL